MKSPRGLDKGVMKVRNIRCRKIWSTATNYNMDANTMVIKVTPSRPHHTSSPTNTGLFVEKSSGDHLWFLYLDVNFEDPDHIAINYSSGLKGKPLDNFKHIVYYKNYKQKLSRKLRRSSANIKETEFILRSRSLC